MGSDPPRVGTGQQQQVGHEPPHALRGPQRCAGSLALLAVELVGQQLEVGEHAGEGRAQLVRRVGHERALARQHALGLGARGVQRLEHALQRAGQLGHLVVGLGMREPPAARVARTLDLAGGAGQLGDRGHRPPRDRQPGEQGERRAGEHADDEEQPHLVDGPVDVRERACELEDRLPEQRDDDRMRLDPIAVGVDAAGVGVREPEVGRAPGLADRVPRQRDDADLGVLGAAVDVEVRADALRVAPGPHDDAPGEVVRRRAHLAVEVGPDPTRGGHADDRGEPHEDHQRQDRGSTGQPPADRQAPIRGGRSLRRGSYVGAGARHRLRASFAGWTRTPRSCS